MKMNRLLPFALCAALALPALAQEVELGYRFVDLTGNEELYRTQINERAGFLLRSLTWNGEGLAQSGFMDSIHLTASELGAGPAGAARLTAGRTGIWKLDLTYRNSQHFDAEPYFANPLTSSGVFLSQHTFDRTRNTFGAELSILPGKIVSPFVGFSYNRYSGPGSTTFTTGGDEFRLTQNLVSTEHEVHLGAAFDVGFLSGHLSQGWRHYAEMEDLTLAPGAGAGNGTGNVLGTNVTLDSLTRSASTKVNTPITEALVTITPVSNVRIVGTYVNATAEGGDSSTDALSGNLVSFELNRFFKSLYETTGTNAKSKTRRGSGRLELTILDGLDFSAGYSERKLTLTGLDLISSLYGSTTTFAGLDPKNVFTALEAHTEMTRTERTFDARLTAKSLGPLSAFVGWSTQQQDLTVTQDPSEIVVPGAQGGTFKRNVQTLDAGLGFRMGGGFASADYQRAQADNPVVRLDFNSRDRYRLRLGYQLANVFSLTASAVQLDTHNDWPDTNYTAKSRQYGAEVSFTPVKFLTARGSMFKFEGDSSITIRLPQNFNLTNSVYAEDGRSWELGGSINLDPVTLDGSFSRFANSGDLPFRILRVRFAADMTFNQRFGAVAEWLQDDYREDAPSLAFGNFLANRYGIYLRIRP